MSSSLVDQIATAVLYEGYLLYPYRASAVKNRQRFNFGVLVPESYSQAQSGTEAWRMQTECLVQGNQPSIRVRIRFLHLVDRQVEEFVFWEGEAPAEPRSTDTHRQGGLAEALSSLNAPSKKGTRPVDFLEFDGNRYQTWQEAIEREVASSPLNVPDLVATPRRIVFVFSHNQSIELVGDKENKPVGRLVRTQRQVQGVLSVSASRINDNLYRLQVAIENSTPLPDAPSLVREQVLRFSFASTHAVLNVDDGEFVSLLEPEEAFVEAAAACQQVGCWPVLVGEPGDRSTMLASPIILYDYPEVAAQSPGDFFDGTEMDEMLMLRVMTMTDEEHREMRHVDEQARRLLERTQTFPQEDLMKLHGTIRGLRSVDRPSDPEHNGVTARS